MNRKSSFTLIEVLVFVTIVSLFFVVAAAVTTSSLRNMRISKNKILAAHYSNELLQWVRGQKESDSAGWTGFTSKAGTYCFVSIPAGSTWPSGSSTTLNSKTACTSGQFVGNPGNPTIFKRELQMTGVSGDTFQVDVTITTSWPEIGGQTLSVVEKTRVSLWE